MCCASRDRNDCLGMGTGGSGKASEESRCLTRVMKDKKQFLRMDQGYTRQREKAWRYGWASQAWGTESRPTWLSAEWEVTRPRSSVGFTSEMLCPVESGALWGDFKQVSDISGFVCKRNHLIVWRMGLKESFLNAGR